MRRLTIVVIFILGTALNTYASNFPQETSTSLLKTTYSCKASPARQIVRYIYSLKSQERIILSNWDDIANSPFFKEYFFFEEWGYFANFPNLSLSDKSFVKNISIGGNLSSVKYLKPGKYSGKIKSVLRSKSLSSDIHVNVYPANRFKTPLGNLSLIPIKLTVTGAQNYTQTIHYSPKHKAIIFIQEQKLQNDSNENSTQCSITEFLELPQEPLRISWPQKGSKLEYECSVNKLSSTQNPKDDKRDTRMNIEVLENNQKKVTLRYYIPGKKRSFTVAGEPLKLYARTFDVHKDLENGSTQNLTFQLSRPVEGENFHFPFLIFGKSSQTDVKSGKTDEGRIFIGALNSEVDDIPKWGKVKYIPINKAVMRGSKVTVSRYDYSEKYNAPIRIFNTQATPGKRIHTQSCQLMNVSN